MGCEAVGGAPLEPGALATGAGAGAFMGGGPGRPFVCAGGAAGAPGCPGIGAASGAVPYTVENS